MKSPRIWTLIVSLILSVNLVAQPTHFSKAEMAADLMFLQQQLTENHPNLYTYSSETEITNWFANQIEKAAERISKEDAFKIVSSISALLKDGHSYIYPSEKHLDDFFNSAPLFPLDVFLTNDQLVVVGNHSKEQSIPLGAILVEINGVKVDDIQSEIVTAVCRDGNNLAYPKHLFYKFFPAYYSFFYGFQSKYELGYYEDSGELKRTSIAGATRAEMKARRKEKTDVGIELALLPDHKSALLTVKSFDDQILKNEYKVRFRKEIRRIFKAIAANEVAHLAIDLRGNQGGALSNGIYLLQYFMHAPFQCVDSFYRLKKGKREKMNSKWDDFFAPKKKLHFNGAVYLFINGGSYSCSAIFANTFKENERGVVLGEMSGGSAFVNSGGPNHTITLPNTKISFIVPGTQYMLRKDMTIIGGGVIPTIVIQDTPGRLMGGEDNYVTKFIELAEKN